jgi:hypothetical protein
MPGIKKIIFIESVHSPLKTIPVKRNEKIEQKISNASFSLVHPVYLLLFFICGVKTNNLSLVQFKTIINNNKYTYCAQTMCLYYSGNLGEDCEQYRLCS